MTSQDADCSDVQQWPTDTKDMPEGEDGTLPFLVNK